MSSIVCLFVSLRYVLQEGVLWTSNRVPGSFFPRSLPLVHLPALVDVFSSRPAPAVDAIHDAWSAIACNAPSVTAFCGDARVYGHTTTAVHGMGTPSPHALAAAADAVHVLDVVGQALSYSPPSPCSAPDVFPTPGACGSSCILYLCFGRAVSLS